MPFGIPNKSVATFPNQSKIFSTDLDILAAGSARTGVVSGGTVAAQGTPNNTVTVGSGLALVAGAIVNVIAGNVTISNADATNPRFDLVVVSSAGTKSATTGTAAANPLPPAVPTNSVVLATVYVPAGDSVVNAGQIIDKRVIVSAHGAYLASKVSDTTINTDNTERVIFTATVPGGLLAPGDRVEMRLHGNYLNNSGGNITLYHTAAFGTTVLAALTQGALATNVNRRKWGGYLDLIARTTTSQSLSMNVPHTSTVSQSFAPHHFIVSGSGSTAEDSSSDKTLEWRYKFDTSAATVEMVATAGTCQIWKATG